MDTTSAVVAVSTAILTLLGKFSWDKIFDKFFNKRNNVDILLELFKQTQEDNKKFYEKSNEMNIKFIESIDKLTSLIQKSNERIIAKNQDHCDLLVRKFSLDLKSKFICDIVSIYDLNHISREKTTIQINTVMSKLLTEFYTDIQTIEGIKEYIYKKEYVISIIESSKFSDSIFDLLVEFKNINDTSKLKRELSNRFDVMFNICYSAEKK